jgi:hypothetical protein
MPDQTTGEPVQGTADPQPQGGTAPDAQGAAGTPVTEPDVEAMRAKIAELERDNRGYRQAAKAREEAEKAKAQAELSEAERLRAENQSLMERATTAERRAQEQSLRLTSAGIASRLGFRNPDLATSLIAARVEYDDAGEPTNVEKLLTDLSKSDPYLLTATDFGGGQRGASAATGPDMNAIIRRAAGRSG